MFTGAMLDKPLIFILIFELMVDSVGAGGGICPISLYANKNLSLGRLIQCGEAIQNHFIGPVKIVLSDSS